MLQVSMRDGWLAEGGARPSWPEYQAEEARPLRPQQREAFPRLGERRRAGSRWPDRRL